MLENPQSTSPRDQLDACKQNVFTAIKKALRDAGVEHVYVNSIELAVRQTAPKCPPGTEPTLEVFERPDGSIVYQVVCK